MSGQIKIGDRITTPDGVGVVLEMEKYSEATNNRYGIKLDTNPYTFPIAFYFHHETKKCVSTDVIT
jgi:hypothetical protein